MLVGGAVTDRLSPRLVLFVPDIARLILAGLMALSVLGGTMSLRMTGAGEPIGASVMSGLAYVLHDETMRVTLLIIAAVSLLFIGPITVGIPVLADQRLPEGAVAFGLPMSGFAGGKLAGYGFPATARRLGSAALRRILVTLLTGFAVALAILGVSASTSADVAVLSVLGIANGYVAISLISTIQARAPKHRLGRVMGFFMFSSLGLVPVSAAISGAISRYDLTLLFAGAAVLTLVVAVWAATQPALAALSQDLARSSP